MNFGCATSMILSSANGYYTSASGTDVLFVITEGGGYRALAQMIVSSSLTLVSGNVMYDNGNNAMTIKGLFITDENTVSVLFQGAFSSKLTG